MWNNPSVHYESVLLSLVNKDADWPVAEQNKVGQESQTENAGKEKGRGVCSRQQMQREARWTCCTEKRYQATWQTIDKKYVLI